jgi:hypothetical protein
MVHPWNRFGFGRWIYLDNRQRELREQPLSASYSSTFGLGNKGGSMTKPKPEYIEGREALQRFNELATQVFRAPKTAVKDVPKSPKRKAKKSSKG